MLSRVAGLIRERVLAHYLGTLPAADAFRAALRIPNFLQNLFGEGVLSASFIPVYSRLLAASDEKDANEVASVIGSLLAVLTSVLVVLGPASAAMQHVPVLDEPIETSSYAGREAGRFLTVADIDTGHPALRSVERFTGVKFYQAIRVAPAKSHVLAKLNDGTPLVIERQVGEGKALVFASTFDNSSNDLPLHASWVPFVQQTAAYLAGGGGTEQPANLTVDAYVELRTADGKGAAEVLGPDGNRLLSLEEAATAKNFAARSEGFFELKAANGRHSLLAVHADRRESDLALMPKETQDLWKATGQSDQTSQGASTLEDQGDKRPWGLWPILLLILLGVAVAESVVADRYLRPPSDDQRKEAA